LGTFGDIAGLGDHLGDRAPLGLVTIEQCWFGGALVHQGKFPGQVDSVLKTAVHAVSLGG
jgi:hypothetical protein